METIWRRCCSSLPAAKSQAEPVWPDEEKGAPRGVPVMVKPPELSPVCRYVSDRTGSALSRQQLGRLEDAIAARKGGLAEPSYLEHLKSTRGAAELVPLSQLVMGMGIAVTPDPRSASVTLGYQGRSVTLYDKLPTYSFFAMCSSFYFLFRRLGGFLRGVSSSLRRLGNIRMGVPRKPKARRRLFSMNRRYEKWTPSG